MHTCRTHNHSGSICLHSLPRSHYSSSHRPNHESSFTKIGTKMKNASKATQWLQWVSACNVICHSLSSLWCDYGMSYGAPCQRRWWPLIGEPGQEPGTLDPSAICHARPGNTASTTAVQMLRDFTSAFARLNGLNRRESLGQTCFLLPLSPPYKHTSTHKSVCIRYVLY